MGSLLNRQSRRAGVMVRSSVNLQGRNLGSIWRSEDEDRRRALLVGFCYSADLQLSGSWNDVADMQSWLQSEGLFSSSEIRVAVESQFMAELSSHKEDVMQRFHRHEELTSPKAGEEGVSHTPARQLDRTCRTEHLEQSMVGIASEKHSVQFPEEVSRTHAALQAEPTTFLETTLSASAACAMVLCLNLQQAPNILQL
eukprot:g15921.t1